MTLRKNLPDLDLENSRKKNLVNFLQKENISLEFFNKWSLEKIQDWIAFNFLPEIIERNLKNLKKINSFCETYLCRNLKEYLLLDDFLKNIDKNNFNFENTKKFQIITLENILNLNIKSLKKWGFDWNPDLIINQENLNKIIRELENLIQERYLLDNYFQIKNYQLKNIRFFILKKLIKLQKKNFFLEIENSLEEQNIKFFPNIKNIILHSFVNYIRENDPYYFQPHKNNIFIDYDIYSIKKNEKDFFIDRNSFIKNIAFSGTNEIIYSEGIQGIFNLIVIFTFHVHKYHYNWVKKYQPYHAFDILMHSFK